ncbi:hypothetical protein UFOVP469_25 [uncultured Caudovirales phage]|uniref:Uncharacterized protein n=1 Tax=uncultured Caudovirales phage TaxID=2100421 RepID=A0A6J5MDM3_9CAUD|nr:hypothetical protein UFOVP469_25 [uncultured Caudovirales phage]CAB4190350.1 hypothetical protein UFOVP1200_55 [uncultured Caudovirales phage]
MPYVLTDNTLIYGMGETSDEAWTDGRQTLEYAQVQLIDDDADTDACHGSWMRESDLRCLPATRGLVTEVAENGGAIGWRERDGFAMTRDEADDWHVARMLEGDA